MVDVRVCRDADGAVGGVECNSPHKRRGDTDGGRAGPTCDPNDSKCKLGCNRGYDEERQCDVSGGGGRGHEADEDQVPEISGSIQ